MSKDYAELLEHASLPVVRKLYERVVSKKTNLCVSADLTKAEQVLELAKAVGPYISVLKTHVDIVNNYSSHFIKTLRAIADDMGFLLFEDRKFADIGNTVKLQASEGIFKITSWADFINAHALPGPGIIEGLRKACIETQKNDIGLLLLAQMTSRGNLITDEYQHRTIEMAKDYPDFVAGWITNQRLTDDPNHVHFTTGIKIGDLSDSLGQQYKTPEQAVSQGSDILIVGRGIIHASNPAETAKLYRDVAWDAVVTC